MKKSLINAMIDGGHIQNEDQTFPVMILPNDGGVFTHSPGMTFAAVHGDAKIELFAIKGNLKQSINPDISFSIAFDTIEKIEESKSGINHVLTVSLKNGKSLPLTTTEISKTHECAAYRNLVECIQKYTETNERV